MELCFEVAAVAGDDRSLSLILSSSLSVSDGGWKTVPFARVSVFSWRSSASHVFLYLLSYSLILFERIVPIYDCWAFKIAVLYFEALRLMIFRLLPSFAVVAYTCSFCTLGVIIWGYCLCLVTLADFWLWSTWLFAWLFYSFRRTTDCGINRDRWIKIS